jgi:hypothetical protein
MNKLIACALVATFACPLTARAVLVSSGTAESITFRQCVAGVTGCDNTFLPTLQLFGGTTPSTNFGTTPDNTFSAANGSLAGFGSAAGFVSLSGVAGEPVLLARANSFAGYRVNTNSVGLQRYTYTGSVPTTRTWSGTLSYSQTLSGTYPSPISNGVFAALDVFTLSSTGFEVGSTPDSNFFAMIDPSTQPGYTDLIPATSTTNVFSDTSTNLHGSGTVSATVTLQPNETVWVWGILQTPATNNSNVDASHTFITAWDNPANLVPGAIAPIPEPTTLSLMAIGLAGIGVARRSRRRASA